MKAIYMTCNACNVVKAIVADDYAESIPADHTLSDAITSDIPSDISTYFYGTSIPAFKLEGTTIVARTHEEMKACPDFLANHGQFTALREVTAKRVADAGETKVFGLVTKKAEGGSLTEAEQTFLTNYLAARETILSEHETMKQAILDSMVSVSGVLVE